MENYVSAAHNFSTLVTSYRQCTCTVIGFGGKPVTDGCESEFTAPRLCKLDFNDLLQLI